MPLLAASEPIKPSHTPTAKPNPNEPLLFNLDTSYRDCQTAPYRAENLQNKPFHDCQTMP